ncbi:MAG: CYTH domain-containing protein [Candidatus Peribacteria bacterium]|nr:MAG: CYTH domain-containing protein [Candidatus Peribacteria bacterium]
MLEKELKILDIDIAHIEHTLTAHGAICTYKGPIYDIIFNKRSKKQKLKVRLRKRTDGARLCFKQKSKAYLESDIKVRQEWEYPVNWWETFQTLQQETHLEPIETRFKHRTVYKIGDVGFDIESYPSLPPFLEIEAPTAELIHEWMRIL